MGNKERMDMKTVTEVDFPELQSQLCIRGKREIPPESMWNQQRF